MANASVVKWETFSILVTIVSPLLCASRDATTDLSDLRMCLSQKGLPASILISKSAVYEYNLLNTPWQLKPPLPEPLAYLIPQSEADIMAMVFCGQKLGVHMVVKGGGHSFGKYSYGDTSSVVIDLRALDFVVVNQENSTAAVGPGNLSGPLGWKLWTSAKALIPTGSCPTVGISGSTLGGGLGSFGGMYGLSLDQVLEMNVVMANGNLVVANKEHNSDLFWALRGGGSNTFGTVTQFVFRTFPAPLSVFQGHFMFERNQFAVVAMVWQQIVAAQTEATSYTMSLAARGNQFRLRMADLSGNDLNFEKLSKLFPTPVSVSKVTYTFPDFLFHQAKILCGQIMREGVNLNFPPDLANLNRSSAIPMYQKRKSYFVQKLVGIPELHALEKFLEQRPSTVSVWFESYGGLPRGIGINETAFVHRGPTLYLAAADYQTPYPNDTGNIAIAHTFIQKFYDLGKTLFNHTGTYQNYVESDLPDYLKRYYGSSLPKLVQIKRKYDPDNFFNYPQSIPMGIEE